MKPYDDLPITWLGPHFQKWLKILQSGEIIQLFYLPYMDAVYRIHQFIDWASDRKQTVVLLDFRSDFLEDETVLRQRLLQEKNPIILLGHDDLLSHPDSSRFLSVIESVYVKTQQGIALVHTGFPSEYQTNSVVVPSSIQQHQWLSPLYDKETTISFIRNVMSDWHMSVPQTIATDIYEMCGGHTWLVTDIIRYVRDHKESTVKLASQQPTFQHKLATFWNSLPEPHRSYILFPPKTQISENETVRHELEDFQLIGENAWCQKTAIREFFTQLRFDVLRIKDTVITYRNQDISASFSKGERRIVSYLHAHPNDIVNRETLGQLFWQDSANSAYSDWALDKIMSRIRKKLVQLRLPVEINTSRGTGYVYRYTRTNL